MNWFHRHGPWEVIGVSCDNFLHHHPARNRYDDSALLTQVAMRCKECGEIKSIELIGRFSMAELQGEELAVSKALAHAAKEMASK